MANHVLRDRIWESNKLARCSRDAALAYPWIFLVADDHGRFEYRPRVIWGRAFAAREDISVEDVSNWLSEYEKIGLLVRYKAGELAYWTGFTGRPPSQRRESLYPDPSTVKEPRGRLRGPYNKDRRGLGHDYELPSQDLPSAEIDRIGSEQSREGADTPATPAPTSLAKLSWNQEAIGDHEDATGGAVSDTYAARTTKALKRLVEKVAKKQAIDFAEAWERVRPYWQAYCRSPAAKFGPESFAANPRQVLESVKRSGVGAMLDALEIES